MFRPSFFTTKTQRAQKRKRSYNLFFLTLTSGFVHSLFIIGVIRCYPWLKITFVCSVPMVQSLLLCSSCLCGKISFLLSPKIKLAIKSLITIIA